MKTKTFLFPVLLLLLASCGEKTSRTASVQKVKCAEVVSASELNTVVSYPGKVSSVSEVNLSFRVPGVIDKIVVSEGDFVRSGQVVALMDDRDYELQRDATQAEYDGIKAEVDRVVALYKEESVPQNTYDKAVSGLKQITSKLSAHNNAYADTKLKAPFSGYIQKINFEKGEAVSAGLPIASFISSGAPEIVVGLPAAQYILLDELGSATATISSYPGKEFSLKYIGTTHKANLNQLYEARFSVEAEDGEYPAVGLSAMVSMNFENHNIDNTIVPLCAVIDKDGKDCVWLLKDGKATCVEVVLGDVMGDGSAIIKGGLSVGDMVITAGLRSLKEGREVELLPKAKASNVGNVL